MVDIHGKFVLWFLWGFIVSLAPCAATPILWIATCIHDMLAKILGGMLSCGIGCGGLAWWISGIVWRFNAAGSFASGDALAIEDIEKMPTEEHDLYQWSSGKFMLYYYLIVWSIMGFSILMAIIGMIATCVCMK